MRLRLETVGLTDVGAQREQNEDAFVIDDRLGFCAVCDGMGGHASGNVASQLAVEAISESLHATSPSAAGEEPLVSAILQANTRIHTHAQRNEECRGMGTTVVAARRQGNLLHLAHVGDSRIYLARGGELTQVTRDHSLTNLYVDNPELEEKLGPADSNVIVRALGLYEYVEVDAQTMDIQPGDVVLLCCDGLTDMVPDPTIAQVLQGAAPLEQRAGRLVDLANQAGGIDNITVVLLEAQPV